MDTRNLREGMTVYSSEGEKLGKIVRLDQGDFIIEKGFFSPKDFLCSYDSVADIRGDEVHLNLDKEQVRGSRGWAGATTSTGYDESRAGATSTTGYGATRASTTTGGYAAGRGASEDMRIPVVEEELTADKTMREAGAVRVTKDVKTEEKEFTVPVTREEVHVERVPASRAARPEAGEATFQEGTTTIPVREEEVEVRKRPVVREEVRVRRDQDVQERRIADTVRKEDVDIEKSGDTTKKYE